MSIINNRRDERIKHVAKIKFFADPNIEKILEMKDFSSIGLFLLCPDTSNIHLDDKVRVQALEIDDAPVVPSIVRRIEEHVGFAVDFILD